VRELGFDKGELTGIWEIEAARTREEDRRDFERELAGIDIGREARFHGTEFVEDRRQSRSGASSTQRSSQQQYASRLQMLLATNPGYAKLYNDTMGALGDAEAATDRAIAKAQKALDEARQQLEQTLTRAAKLPDGTRVFRDARGNVWNERGQRVSEVDAEGIEWRGDEPAYEQFLEESESVKDRLTRLEALQGYRVDTLGGIRDRMDDKENPPSSEEVEGFKREIHEKMPPEVHAERQAAFQPLPKPDERPDSIPVRSL
jgi:cell division septum initiation protein DivIVA